MAEIEEGKGEWYGNRHARPSIRHYIITVAGCTEPEIAAGPYPKDSDEFDQKARELRADQDDEDAIFGLTIGEDGEPNVWSFSNAFFEDE